MCKTSKKILLRLGPSTKFGNAAAIALVLVGLCRRRHFGAHFCHSKWPKIPPMGLKMGHKWPRMTESSGKTPFSQSWWFVWWHFERTHGVFLENPIFWPTFDPFVCLTCLKYGNIFYIHGHCSFFMLHMELYRCFYRIGQHSCTCNTHSDSRIPCPLPSCPPTRLPMFALSARSRIGLLQIGFMC